LALDAAAQAEIDALRALAWLQEPGQQRKALDLVARLVAQPNPPRAVELGNALIQLGETDEATIKAVQQNVTQLVARIPNQPDKARFRRGRRRLADAAVRRLLAVVDKPPNWALLLKELSQGEQTDWKKVAQAECLLQQNKAVDPADLKRAHDLLDAKPPPD